MKMITGIFLRSALVAIFLSTVGVGLANAQWSGGSWGGGSYDDGGNNCAGGTSGSRNSGSLRIIGLTSDQRLICFSEFSPGSASTVGSVTGLSGGDTFLVGVDFRPATGANGSGGVLYGLGNAGGVYTISVQNAQATFRSRLNVALSGTSFGVDFNPVVDRLRIISDNGQNLRANVDTGATLVDGTLTYPPATTPATGVTGAAYTNNDSDPNTVTTLYDIDSMLDQVAIQSPANSGQLSATGKLTTDTNASVGFDIYSTIRNNSTVNVEGFASLTGTDNFARFYTITLFTGKATSRGPFSSQNQVVDIAIALNQR